MEKKIFVYENATFIKDRDTIRDFISRVRRVQYLADITGVSKSTVERTFKVDDFTDLSGNMLFVWENAIKMYEDFNLLKEKTHLIAKSIRKEE